jgi:hypothetical protein
MATWPNLNATQGEFTNSSSGYKGSVGSPVHASTLQATDQEMGPWVQMIKIGLGSMGSLVYSHKVVVALIWASRPNIKMILHILLIPH